MIEISVSSEHTPPPPVAGLEIAGDEWKLDPTQYAGFVGEITGLTPTSDLDPSDCYRIGNRLEAYIETRKRSGEWNSEVVETHADLQSLDEVLALARFYRECHASRIDGC